MELLIECGILLGICVAGETVRIVTGLPIPGNIFGMVILFTLLATGILKKSRIEQVSGFFLKYMTLFFVPSGVAILMYYDEIRSVVVPFLLIIVFTTFLVMGATGWSAQLLQRWLSKRRGEPPGVIEEEPNEETGVE